MADVFQPVADTVEVSVQGSMDSQLIENKFYVHVGEAVTQAIVERLAELFADWATATMAAQLPSDWTFTRAVARDLTAEASFEAVNADGAGTAGGLSGGRMSNNSTLAIHRNTGFSGKKAKSRIYWPGISASSISGADHISTASGAAMVSALNTLRSLVLADTTATFTYGYVQRIVNGVKLAAGNFIEVTGHSLIDTILDSQRRRLPGRGV